MKETNSLEMQLRSWELRAPSPKFKARLFSQAEVHASRENWSFQWLAPVAACCLLTAMILNQVGPIGHESSESSNIRTVAVSNQTPAALSGSGFVSTASNRFEWTNGSAFTSSVTSFLPGQVN